MLRYSHTYRFFISIHALLAESDIEKDLCQIVADFHFYPRSPCGERRAPRITPTASRNFYPRSPCGERRGSGVGSWPRGIFLSTLSLRRATGILAISLRIVFAEFLSTLSLRRATYLGAGQSCDVRDFYPRSPCGERQSLGLLGWLRVLISIHALLAESDVSFMLYDTSSLIFLSTLSLRRATHLFASSGVDFAISIHALLAESDWHH